MPILTTPPVACPKVHRWRWDGGRYYCERCLKIHRPKSPDTERDRDDD